ncbi:MAG: ABC transporter ATP-binding protein, partial [Christensenellales bacterium]
VISNISFKCSPGETTAIIGATGSGKSTLIKLIPRLYDVTEGCIRLDGRDVREYTLESLRDNVAYVLQKNLLFSGTIESNIKFADEDAADGDDRMKRSAEIAQATEFISEKDDGFQSEIVQGGGNVSGGQKQRLSIARALYKNSPLLVFDDSFSALDFKTDAKLRAAIKSSEGGKNVLIVAQRVGTIMNADRIIVLDEGRIAGLGTHKELMKTCRVYADIARSQLSEEELKNE